MNVLITGANTGIGAATAKDLARRGHTIFFACRSAYRELRANGGDVVVLSSAAVPDACAGYAAAKAGVEALVAGLQREWADSGVGVSLVHLTEETVTLSAIRDAVAP